MTSVPGPPRPSMATRRRPGSPRSAARYQAGAWAQYELGAPVSFDEMHLQVVTDDQHSIPTEITVSAGGKSDTVRLPRLLPARSAARSPTYPSCFRPLTGSTVRVTVDQVQLRYTVDYTTQARVALPFGIAEWGIPGLAIGPGPQRPFRRRAGAIYSPWTAAPCGSR